MLTSVVYPSNPTSGCNRNQ